MKEKNLIKTNKQKIARTVGQQEAKIFIATVHRESQEDISNDKKIIILQKE